MRAFALVPCLTILFAGAAGAAQKVHSIDAAEARNISRDGFLFGVPVVYIDLSAEVGSNVPEPQGRRSPINRSTVAKGWGDRAAVDISQPDPGR